MGGRKIVGREEERVIVGREEEGVIDGREEAEMDGREEGGGG